MKLIFKISLGLALFLLFPVVMQADEIPSEWHRTITIKDDFHSVKLNTARHANFFHQEQRYFLREKEVFFPVKNYCSDQEEEQDMTGVEVRTEWAVSNYAIEEYLKSLALDWNTEKEDVRIYKDEADNIQFEGVGVPQKKLNLTVSAKIIEKAIVNGLDFATLAFDIVPPQITVEDEELQDLGIKDLLAIGKSDFAGSPSNRIHNIHLGASRFNGVLIPQGAEFSFNTTLGSVGPQAGYRQELVIKGDRTVPDYGGGLCQVSTTTFRAALLAGLEIVERWPHAYAVDYYEPWGSDATIYLGGKNLRFKNDTNGAILIQTKIEGSYLYFHFYGTKDERVIALFGPYISGWKAAPEARTEYTADLAPGTKQTVSGKHPGFNVWWHQMVQKSSDTEMIVKSFFSPFEARGYYFLIGKEKEPDYINAPI